MEEESLRGVHTSRTFGRTALLRSLTLALLTGERVALAAEEGDELCDMAMDIVMGAFGSEVRTRAAAALS